MTNTNNSDHLPKHGYTEKEEETLDVTSDEVASNVERTSIIGKGNDRVKSTEDASAVVTPQGEVLSDTLVTTPDVKKEPWYKNATVMFFVGLLVSGVILGAFLAVQLNKDHRQLVAETTTSTNLSEQLAQGQVDLTTLAKEYDALQKEKSKVDGELKDANADLDKANTEIETLNEKIETLEKAVETDQKEVSDSKEALKQANDKLDTANKKIDELTKELNEAKQANTPTDN